LKTYGSNIPDELLAIEQFNIMLEAQVRVADWRTEYNTYRPTRPGHAQPPPGSPGNGGPKTSHSSHGEWTSNRDRS
jgi:hypothetical protein